MAGWIGVDLDKTLAVYDGYKGESHIGAPIPEMVERVKAWLAQGVDVRIMTARVSNPGALASRMVEVYRAKVAISAWCLEHIGQILPITSEKDYQMFQLWDDRAVQVEPNTGKVLSPSWEEYKA